MNWIEFFNQDLFTVTHSKYCTVHFLIFPFSFRG